MKKIAAILVTLVLLLGAFGATFSVSAATYTKDDVIAVVSESPLYKYVKNDIAKLARSINPTEDQLVKLHDIAERFVALKLTDKSNSASEFTADEVAAVLALIDEACDVLDLTYDFTPSKDPKHAHDVVFNLYDANNKVIYRYDGDVINKTGADVNVTYVVIAALGCLLLAGAAVAVVKTRKVRV